MPGGNRLTQGVSSSEIRKPFTERPEYGDAYRPSQWVWDARCPFRESRRGNWGGNPRTLPPDPLSGRFRHTRGNSDELWGRALAWNTEGRGVLLARSVGLPHSPFMLTIHSDQPAIVKC